MSTEHPVWYVLRSDNGGKYLQIRTVEQDKLTTIELSIYDRIVEIWNK